MDNVIFLDIEEILAIHHDQIVRYGGIAGLRDWDRLHSAAAMPLATSGGQSLHQDVFEMAAAYLLHLVSNHPFLDGNKRTGTVAALVFLMLNEIEIKADEIEFESLVRTVAEGHSDKETIAQFFRKLAV